MRTPKMDERATLGMALGMARGEAVLTVLLWLAALVLWNGIGADRSRGAAVVAVHGRAVAALRRRGAGVGGQRAGADAPRPRVFETAPAPVVASGGDAARTIGHAHRRTRRHRPFPEALVAPAPRHGGGRAERTPACRGAGADDAVRDPGPRRPRDRAGRRHRRGHQGAAGRRHPRRAAGAGRARSGAGRLPAPAFSRTADHRGRCRAPAAPAGDAPDRQGRRRGVGPAAAVAADRGRERHRATACSRRCRAGRRWCSSPTGRRRRCRAACARASVWSARAAGASGATCRRPWSGPSEGPRRDRASVSTSPCVPGSPGTSTASRCAGAAIPAACAMPPSRSW